MSLRKNSWDTLTSNLVAQGVGVLYFFLLPNILSVADYALVVYWGLLVYYSRFMDFGLLNVYVRKAPGMLVQNKQEELQSLEGAVQYFLRISAFIYSLFAAAFLYYKTHSLAVAAFAVPVITLTPLLTLYLQKVSVRGGFGRYKRITIVDAVGRSLGIIGAHWAEFAGYMAGLLAALFATFAYVRDPAAYRHGSRVSVRELFKLIPEGMVLAALTMIWGTLLMLGRFYSAMVSGPETVAVYGVIHSGYQIITSIIIALCLPVTIRIYSLCVGDKSELLWFVTKIQVILISAVTVVCLIISSIAPIILPLLFKKYIFNDNMIHLMIMSAVAVPILATSGSALIGRAMAKPYLAALGLIFGASFLFLKVATPVYGVVAPAVIQFASILATGLILILMIWMLMTHRTFKSMIVLLLPVWCLFLISAFYAVLRYFSGLVLANEMHCIIGTNIVVSACVACVFAYCWRVPLVNQKAKEIYFKYVAAV